MNHSTPKVSVVMSVYNGDRYLQEAIDSILNQTFADFEFIIINDCSTDNTWEILTDYASRDDRVVLLNNDENLGLTKSLNKGLEVARGEYIARQDADDISLPKRFEKQVSYMDLHSSVAFVSTGVQYINGEGEQTWVYTPPIDPIELSWYLLFRNPIRHSTALWRRELVSRAVGNYDPTFVYSQDYDLWVRIAEKFPIHTLPLILLKLRWHEQSITLTKMSVQDRLSNLVTRRQFQRYLPASNISAEDTLGIRSMPRLKYEPQQQYYIGLPSKQFLRAASQYLQLWIEFRKHHEPVENSQILEELQAELEADLFALLKRCQQQRWALVSSKLILLFIWNCPRHARVFVAVILKKLVQSTVVRIRHQGKKLLLGQS
jgi:glycosyltransferase involved in cell wall biosynthesis